MVHTQKLPGSLDGDCVGGEEVQGRQEDSGKVGFPSSPQRGMEKANCSGQFPGPTPVLLRGALQAGPVRRLPGLNSGLFKAQSYGVHRSCLNWRGWGRGRGKRHSSHQSQESKVTLLVVSDRSLFVITAQAFWQGSPGTPQSC